jgi:anti-anti-sigma factor
MKWKVMSARLRGDVVVIDLAWANCEHAEDEVSALIVDMLDQGFRGFVLNPVRIRYFDSSDLGGLLRASKAVTRKGGKLSLLDSYGQVRHLLDTTLLGSPLVVFTSEDEAVRSVRSVRVHATASPERLSLPATRA